MPRLLMVVDDSDVNQIRTKLPSDLCDVETVPLASDAIVQFQRTSFDAVVIGVRGVECAGIHLLKEIRSINDSVPIIVLADHRSAKLAIEATQQGAYDYLCKPLVADGLERVLGRAFEASRLSKGVQRFPIQTLTVDDELLTGRCPAMQEVYRQIGRIADQDVTVLILGESGTGKEVVARAIYQHSKRARHSFRAINCAAIPENLLESELFGHEKGAFTGAERVRIGKFEQCHGGTLFLDEIGDMPSLTQTKILRVLQDQQFERIGGNEMVQTDVRLIAATNRNLTEMMHQGTFRSDLYYRLNCYTIHLPPLRERSGDLPLLIFRFLEQFCRELDKGLKGISPQAMSLLTSYSWPGNLRELQSVLKHAIVRSTGSILLPEFLPESLRGDEIADSRAAAHRESSERSIEQDFDYYIRRRVQLGSNNLYDEIIQDIERVLLTDLLHQVDGNISRAAAVLGISRSTLRLKLTACGIAVERAIHVNPEPQ